MDAYECPDCDRAERKWGYFPDGQRLTDSAGMRIEKKNERRARRYRERQALRRGLEPGGPVTRKWLD